MNINTKYSLLGKIARIIAAIYLLLLGILFGVLGAFGVIILITKNIRSLPEGVITILFGWFLLYSFYALLKNSRKVFPLIICVLIGDYIYSVVYRFFFVVKGQFTVTDLHNLFILTIPIGLILISKKLEQDVVSNVDSSIHTESLSQSFQYASVIERGIAVFIDQLIIVVPILLLGFIMRSISKDINWILFELLASFLYLIYVCVWEAKDGQTLGKKVLKIKVIMENGQSCTVRAAIIRNISRSIDHFLGIFLILLISLTSKKQRIGDMLAHTIVVKL